jgi:hypothetical protein
MGLKHLRLGARRTAADRFRKHSSGKTLWSGEELAVFSEESVGAMAAKHQA